jgi:hypothetical protein
LREWQIQFFGLLASKSSKHRAPVWARDITAAGHERLTKRKPALTHLIRRLACSEDQLAVREHSSPAQAELVQINKRK